MVTGIVVGLSTVALLLGLFLLLRWARRGVAASLGELTEIAAGRSAVRQSRAQSFGIRSKGATQMRGLGHLALFEEELVFVQAIASNHIRAKRSEIVSVTTPRSFLGKTQGVRLLAVEWNTSDGTDQIGLRVPDLDAWVADLTRPAT